jgi:uncharacterized metal-binding protein
MPNHRTHEVVGMTATPAVFYIAAIYLQDMNTAVLLTALYIFATFYLTPDLDIDSAPYHRWGVFSLLWYPYKKFIPHRSWLSHSGPISATIRFAYLTIIASVVIYFIAPAYLILTNPFLWIILLYAMIVVDCLHTLLDFIWKD